jgi:hypothetical protein
MSDGGSAAQLSVTSGRLLRELRLWMAWATKLLPTPVSPRSSTVLDVGATCWTFETTFVLVALVSAFVVSVRAVWARLAMRVAGSWVAAIGLLMLGWSLGSGI